MLSLMAASLDDEGPSSHECAADVRTLAPCPPRRRPCTNALAGCPSSSAWSTGSTRASRAIRCCCACTPTRRTSPPRAGTCRCSSLSTGAGPRPTPEPRVPSLVGVGRGPAPVLSEEQRQVPAAVASLDPESDIRRALEEYFETAAESM